MYTFINVFVLGVMLVVSCPPDEKIKDRTDIGHRDFICWKNAIYKYRIDNSGGIVNSFAPFELVVMRCQ